MKKILIAVAIVIAVVAVYLFPEASRLSKQASASASLDVMSPKLVKEQNPKKITVSAPEIIVTFNP